MYRSYWNSIAVLAGALFFLASPAGAQDITLSLGDDASLAGRGIQLFLLVTILSIVPGLAIMVTCFPFIVTVLSILRQAIGLQQSPPNMLIVSLALFLTYFVMEPVFLEAWVNGLDPLSKGLIGIETAFELTMEPFRAFMAARIDPDTFQGLADLRESGDGLGDLAPTSPLSLLVPSFLLSEVERAFQIGFLIFLPFLGINTQMLYF